MKVISIFIKILVYLCKRIKLTYLKIISTDESVYGVWEQCDMEIK